MHNIRRMPLLTAVNVDGNQIIDFRRENNNWKFDRRILENKPLEINFDGDILL